MRTTRLLGVVTAAVLSAAGTGTATASVFHTVRRGETLTSIAATDGLSVGELAAANGLGSGSLLATGRRLVIPARGAAGAPVAGATSVSATSEPTPATSEPAASASAGGVLVVRGDTLSAIAVRYGTTVDALAAANGMSPSGLLLAGRTLTIPGASPASPTAAAVEPAATSDAAVPVHEFVSPSQVGEIAAQDGVSPSLAEAIADQESGFDDAEVSRTGATGVMQIEPGTWRDLTGADGLRLSPDSATDNVRGGVALLHELLAQTGGDETEAIAAYYQGLESLRRRGMYDGTRRYVRSVLALQGRY